MIWRRGRSQRADREEPVKVASAGNEAIAAMWREVLEQNAIPCMTRIVGPLTGYATFASPHDLYVSAANAARARDLLAAYNADESDLALGREDEDDEYWREGAEDDREPHG